MDGKERRAAHTKESGSSEKDRGKKAEKPPTERDEDSRRAGLLWLLAGTQMLFKDALCHPRTQSSPRLYFILRSAATAESARRFHRPDQPLISKTSSHKRIGPGNPCQGLGPMYADPCASPYFAFDWIRPIESRGRLGLKCYSSIRLPLKSVFPSSFFTQT